MTEIPCQQCLWPPSSCLESTARLLLVISRRDYSFKLNILGDQIDPLAGLSVSPRLIPTSRLPSAPRSGLAYYFEEGYTNNLMLPRGLRFILVPLEDGVSIF